MKEIADHLGHVGRHAARPGHIRRRRAGHHGQPERASVFARGKPPREGPRHAGNR